MSLIIAAKDIKSPKIEVAPPVWAKAIIGLVLALVLIVIARIPTNHPVYIYYCPAE